MRQRFERLVDDHGPRLLQLATGLLGRADEAEDVVQDVFIRAWDRLDELEAGREIAWLVTCTRNASLDLLRGRTRQGALLRSVHDARPGGSDRTDAVQPDDRLQAEERARTLRGRIRSMPEPGRSLLILRDLQDLDVATVARALDLSPNQVKVYTHRARRALRKELRELDREDADEQVA
ncbi:MAG: sigma-70 family RNA polymerase sigma factor [Wenzhouxiangellaceae bacterium]|nr:sigma-70 family RNA polymerase sigma factor [Wenzhouxiangellaceae bacterium]